MTGHKVGGMRESAAHHGLTLFSLDPHNGTVEPRHVLCLVTGLKLSTDMSALAAAKCRILSEPGAICRMNLQHIAHMMSDMNWTRQTLRSLPEAF